MEGGGARGVPGRLHAAHSRGSLPGGDGAPPSDGRSRQALRGQTSGGASRRPPPRSRRRSSPVAAAALKARRDARPSTGAARPRGSGRVRPGRATAKRQRQPSPASCARCGQRRLCLSSLASVRHEAAAAASSPPALGGCSVLNSRLAAAAAFGQQRRRRLSTRFSRRATPPPPPRLTLSCAAEGCSPKRPLASSRLERGQPSEPWNARARSLALPAHLAGFGGWHATVAGRVSWRPLPPALRRFPRLCALQRGGGWRRDRCASTFTACNVYCAVPSLDSRDYVPKSSVAGLCSGQSLGHLKEEPS